MKIAHRALECDGTIEGNLAPFAPELMQLLSILVRGTEVVIPKPLRKKMQQRLFESHLEINKCKVRARMLMCWPGMHAEIVDKIGKCATCQRYTYQQPTEPLLLGQCPDQPLACVGTHLLWYAGKSCPVVYDLCSNYRKVEYPYAVTSHLVIDKLPSMFA